MNHSSRRGQSLVEVLIALSILTTGIVGILSLLSQSIYVSKTVSNESTATYLAEEGIEVAGNLINHDMYQAIATTPPVPGAAWGNCFNSAPPSPVEIDYKTTDCSAIHSYSSSDFLYFDPSTNTYLYNYDGVSSAAYASVFTREILVASHGNEITVDSIVQWPSSGSMQSVELEDQFYDWHP